MNFLKRLFKDRSWFVLMDPIDNSVTFSPALAEHMRKATITGKLMVVTINEGNEYAIILDPPYTEKQTQLADIQYNEKYKCIGFESLIPTVNRIYDSYNLPLGSQCKLSVTGPHKAGTTTYYTIHRP